MSNTKGLPLPVDREESLHEDLAAQAYGWPNYATMELGALTIL